MEKVDILNRDDFVAQLVLLIENISENKKRTCFAIDGVWGCGKSFVLDMLEDQLTIMQSEETGTDRYFVLRYNSWKSDYYEEPLIAIVSAMISTIEEKTKLFPDSEAKRKFLGTLKATGISLLSLGSAAVKEKTGIDLQKAYEVIKEGNEAGEEAYANKHEYDVYFGFNQALRKLSELLQELAETYTVIILVDELDRCIPDYAVRVLERLHHLTEGSSNIITVVAIDKVQLVSSVKQLFGFEKPEKYLGKFFDFEIALDYGTVSEKINEKYAEYFDLFDRSMFPFNDSVEECLAAIFTDIDIRTQEHLINKAIIAHKLLFSEKKDYSFMCMELLLTVLICIYNDTSCFRNQHVLGSSPADIFKISAIKDPPAFAKPFNDKFEEVGFQTKRDFTSEPMRYVLPNKTSLYGAIAYLWYWMHPQNPRYVVQRTKGDAYEPISNNHQELTKFAETVRLIK